MDYMKKRKMKKFFQKHKKIIIGTGTFLLIGLAAGLTGFEIQQKGHAIRNWLASPWASTFFILIGLGLIIIALLIITLINMRGDE